jgi:hypothetical protein
VAIELIFMTKDSLLHARLSELQLREHKDKPASRGGILAAPATYFMVIKFTFSWSGAKKWLAGERFCSAGTVGVEIVAEQPLHYLLIFKIAI